jgi:exodeoxyribonuclease VII small subunit
MKKKDTNTFEKKIVRLEEISNLLEAEETQLEDAIKLFEEGIELSKDCLTTLKSAEIKITELKKKIDSVSLENKGRKKKNDGDE